MFSRIRLSRKNENKMKIIGRNDDLVWQKQNKLKNALKYGNDKMCATVEKVCKKSCRRTVLS